MRPPPSSAPLAAVVISKNQSVVYPTLSSSTATPSCSPSTCRWTPYSNTNDFETNAILILIILFCALISALGLNAAIRCFLRSSGSSSSSQLQRSSADRLPQNNNQQQRKPTLQAEAAQLVVAPTLVYSAGVKLAGEEAECAICLSEFVEGDAIQVLGRCKHGFHVHCIQQWLSSHYSCPTCRCSCLPDSPSISHLDASHTGS